jgi:deoxyribodipyrimidine photolyase
MQFLLETLNDLDSQLRAVGGRLFVFTGAPEQIFRRLWEEKSVTKICFEKVRRTTNLKKKSIVTIKVVYRIKILKR